MEKSKAIEQIEKKMDLLNEVDEVIKSICEKIRKSDCTPGEYADTVKALAELVNARAEMERRNSAQVVKHILLNKEGVHMAGRKRKEPTYRFFIKDKEGNPVNIDTLTEEERHEVGVWAYQTLLRGLGYVPVGTKKP